MKKFVFVFFLAITSGIHFAYSQECDRQFNMLLNYVNPAVGADYHDYPVTIQYKVYKRFGSSFTCDANNLDIVKPVIVVEGYDIFDRENTTDIYNHYVNANGGAGTTLRSLGYDIITYNLNVPAAPIQVNAVILEAFISYINEKKSSTEELTIMGVSLGGILARYALVHMENQKIDHKTKLFISFDSPHRGANVPLSMQAFISNYGYLGFFSGDYARLFNNYAAVGTTQLIRNHLSMVSGGTVGPHSLHTNLLSEMNSLSGPYGHPQYTKCVAISNGDLNGTLQQNANLPGGCAIIVYIGFGSRVLQAAPWDSDPFGDGKMSFLYKVNPHDINADWYLNVGSNALPIDHVSGGWYPWYDELEEQVINAGGSTDFNLKHLATFVATNSALDLTSNNSKLNYASYGKTRILNNTPFEDIWWDTSHQNQQHTSLTTNLSTWIVDQVTGTTTPTGPYSVTVTATPNKSGFKAGYHIETSGTVEVQSSSYSTMVAKNDILLKPGFHAISGSTFRAYTADIRTKKSSVVNDLPGLTSQNASSRETASNDYYIEDLSIDGITIKITQSYSNPTDITTLTKEDLDLIAFPNPTVDNVKFSHGNDIKKVTVTDANGKSLSNVSHTSAVGVHTVDLTNVGAGVYFLVIETGSKTVYRKVIKN